MGATVKKLPYRLTAHLKRPTNAEMAKWLQRLEGLGMRPDIVLLEETEDPTAEGRWLKRMLETGSNLLNETRDGIGGVGRR